MMVREAELIERRLNVLGDLLIQARMADEMAGICYFPIAQPRSK